MKKIVTSMMLLSMLGIAAAFQLNGNRMNKIEFVLGGNIVETAKASGIVEFSASNTNGSIEYSVRPLQETITVAYAKPGYEINLIPAFSLVFNADRRRSPNDIVIRARVRLANRSIRNHEDGQQVVEELIKQFNRGKWERHISASCPAVTGRSSFLDYSGELSTAGCSLDPEYKIDPRDWVKLIKNGQNYEWVGDGILATLSAGFDDDTRGITYNLVVNFEDHATKKKIDLENEQRRRAEGDAKGWNTTAKAEERAKQRVEIVKRLEEIAVKRGDARIPR